MKDLTLTQFCLYHHRKHPYQIVV